jgi:hypothetical protein
MLVVNALYLHIHYQLKTNQMKNKLKTIWHDFRIDPYYHIILILSIALISILMVGGMLSVIQTLIK